MTRDELLKMSSRLLADNTRMESEMAQMQFQIDQMRRLLYGSKRERFNPDAQDANQMTLPFEVEQEAAPEKDQETIT